MTTPAGDEPPRRLAPAQRDENIEGQAGENDDGRARGGRGQRRLKSGRLSAAGRAGIVYFADPETRERVRAAFRHCGGAEGFTSESDWWSSVIEDAARAWEVAHNGGRAFPSPTRERRARPRPAPP